MILNLMPKKGKRDRRFSESTIYSYLGMNSNYSLFLQRISASRAVCLFGSSTEIFKAGILARLAASWLFTL